MTPASYWKQVREACDRATPGPWEIYETGEWPRVQRPIEVDEDCEPDWEHISDLDDGVADGDKAFIALARSALPLALSRIEELEAVAHQRAEEANEAYERGVREGAATVRGWSKGRIEELEAALRAQMMEPSRWQDEDIDGVPFGDVAWVCQHCGSADATADAIEHDDDCRYGIARAALGAK